MVIYINYDFSTGKELSYYEGNENKRSKFETHCLLFFNRKKDQVYILRKDGMYINNQEIYKNDGKYTYKEIRKSHNLLRMFLSGCFKWQRLEN